MQYWAEQAGRTVQTVESMKNTETDEFELVLGSGQLLSGIFVVLILFAAFFVMGYIVGCNASAWAQLASNRAHNNGPAGPSDTRPQPVSKTAGAGQNSPAAAAQPLKGDPGAATPGADPHSSTQPAQLGETKMLPAPPDQPAPGESYLQTYSGKQEVAATFANTLKQRGFPTLLSPGPEGKTRVLVGPYPDLGKLGQGKADLERLGFSSFRQKIEH
ncbi:MAG: hypothetical protein ABSF54_21405 [Bryobacteraceae bacterium]|jgi:hypothetical protein